MRELQEIIVRYAAAKNAGQAAALATVVRVSGSTYRRPGARMLITDDGRVTGCVSGGCLEKSVFDHARRALSTGHARVVTYDSTADDEIAWGFGLGCNGVVEVLIEPLNGRSLDPLPFIASCFERRADGAIATIIAIEGDVDAQVGDRMVFSPGAEYSGRFADAAVQDAARVALARVLAGNSECIPARAAEARVDLFVERVRPPLPLLVFGAGHDALPLVRIARELGWHTTLIDYRQVNLARARTAGADAVIAARPGEIAERLTVDPRAAAVIMNHNFADDLETLRTLARTPVDYIGVLGPRQRTDRILQELRAAGVQVDAARLFAPVGLDIGADNPEEIALAVLAEITATLRRHAGGPLRNRDGPLHERGDGQRDARAFGTSSELTCAVTQSDSY